MSERKATQKAREQASQHPAECFVVYRDPDAGEFYWCPQDAFEKMIDLGDARAEWVTATYCR